MPPHDLSSDFLASTCTEVNKVMSGKADLRHRGYERVSDWICFRFPPVCRKWIDANQNPVILLASLPGCKWRAHIHLFIYLFISLAILRVTVPSSYTEKQWKDCWMFSPQSDHLTSAYFWNYFNESIFQIYILSPFHLKNILLNICKSIERENMSH